MVTPVKWIPQIDAYEGFLLLCAIQVHDVGNVFGREEHEKKCREILQRQGSLILPDNPEIMEISRIAMVHGGAYGDDRDTISALLPNTGLKARTIKPRFLAALLRFADELADDSTRADQEALDNGLMPQWSRIYHEYSRSLHSVSVDRPENGPIGVSLFYEFSDELATQTLEKNGKDKLLLDEIYDRTIKMERERRYCMRFLRPNISVDEIRVKITIQNSRNLIKNDVITYTLAEVGYPDTPVSGRIKDFGEEIRNGKEEKQHLIEKWQLEV